MGEIIAEIRFNLTKFWVYGKILTMKKIEDYLTELGKSFLGLWIYRLYGEKETYCVTVEIIMILGIIKHR